MDTWLTLGVYLVYSDGMTTKAEVLTETATTAHNCWTCGGAPNPANFGGLCDSCDEARKARLRNSAHILAEHGLSDTQEGRALDYLGYGRGR